MYYNKGDKIKGKYRTSFDGQLVEVIEGGNLTDKITVKYGEVIVEVYGLLFDLVENKYNIPTVLSSNFPKDLIE